jgi:hypothetical protein
LPQVSNAAEGRVQETFDDAWGLEQPFVLTSQTWVLNMDQDESLKEFMSSFVGAFEVSSLKATVGRAQKKLPDEVMNARLTVITQLNNAIPDANFVIPVADEGGFSENMHSELLAASTVSAYIMASGSFSSPGFENYEVHIASALSPCIPGIVVPCRVLIVTSSCPRRACIVPGPARDEDDDSWRGQAEDETRLRQGHDQTRREHDEDRLRESPGPDRFSKQAVRGLTWLLGRSGPWFSLSLPVVSL